MAGRRRQGAAEPLRNETRQLAHFDAADRPFYAALAVQDAKVTLLGYLSHALLCLGHLDQAGLQQLLREGFR